MSMQWETKIPSEPTSRLVLVSNIAQKTEESTIKDFFSFCGVIESFEMKPETETQKALILFQLESSANTATLLSQAEIDENPIQVEYYFKQQEEVTAGKETTAASAAAVEKAPAKTKSASHVMAELLASGYVLKENVIAKGVDFDERHGGKLNGYFTKMSGHFSHFQQRFSSKDELNRETTNSTSRMQQLKSSKTGIKLHNYASRVANKVTQVHEEAKRIAAEKSATNQAKQ